VSKKIHCRAQDARVGVRWNAIAIFALSKPTFFPTLISFRLASVELVAAQAGALRFAADLASLGADDTDISVSSVLPARFTNQIERCILTIIWLLFQPVLLTRRGPESSAFDLQKTF